MRFSSAALMAATSFIAGTSAHITFGCGGSILQDRSDPLISPGKVSAHAHRIAGGNAFDLEIDYDIARTSTCSSCPIKADLSNYWTPKLYYHKQDGTFVSVPMKGQATDDYGGMTVYYLQRGTNTTMKAFPENFRMFAGDPTKRDYGGDFASEAISYACLGTDHDETNEFPNYNCPGGLRAQVFFPSCWDGVNKDSLDHKSHMSYPESGHYNGGTCPSSHPVQMVSLFYELLYDVDAFANEWYGDSQPFVWANGDPTGYSFHGDFVNGWDVDVLQAVVDECDDPQAFGQLSLCNPIKDDLFTGDEMNKCRIPSFFDEIVTGDLATLPGCNPVTSTSAELTASLADTACIDKANAVQPIANPTGPFTDVSSKGFSYLGCGTDSTGSRTLTGANTASDTMTVETCGAFCKGKGAKYFGVEYGRECYCGDSIPADRMPSTDSRILGICTTPCSGDATEFCGFAAALGLYEVCADAANCKNAEATTYPKPSSTASTTTASSSTASSTASSASTPASSTTMSSVVTSSSSTAAAVAKEDVTSTSSVSTTATVAATSTASTSSSTSTSTAAAAASTKPASGSTCTTSKTNKSAYSKRSRTGSNSKRGRSGSHSKRGRSGSNSKRGRSGSN